MIVYNNKIVTSSELLDDFHTNADMGTYGVQVTNYSNREIEIEIIPDGTADIIPAYALATYPIEFVRLAQVTIKDRGQSAASALDYMHVSLAFIKTPVTRDMTLMGNMPTYVQSIIVTALQGVSAIFGGIANADGTVTIKDGTGATFIEITKDGIKVIEAADKYIILNADGIKFYNYQPANPEEFEYTYSGADTAYLEAYQATLYGYGSTQSKLYMEYAPTDETARPRIIGDIDAYGAWKFISSVTGVAPTTDLHLATKKYVDDNAGNTAAEILTLLKTVDGSGSGLDADVVDGMFHQYTVATGVGTTFSIALPAITSSGLYLITFYGRGSSGRAKFGGMGLLDVNSSTTDGFDFEMIKNSEGYASYSSVKATKVLTLNFSHGYTLYQTVRAWRIG